MGRKISISIAADLWIDFYQYIIRFYNWHLSLPKMNFLLSLGLNYLQLFPDSAREVSQVKQMRFGSISQTCFGSDLLQFRLS